MSEWRRLLRRAFARLAMTPSCFQRRADVDLRLQRAVHRALVGDLEQPRALRGVERALQRDAALDAVELPFLGLALRAINRMDFLMRERDRDALERQLLVVGIEPQRHRAAGAEAGE